MTESSLKIYVSTTPDGKFFAATNQSPYFCFEAESEEAVLEKAKNGLAFYVGARAEHRASPTTEQTVTQFIPSRVVTSEDLGVSA